MAKAKTHFIRGVTALYPKINTTYRFDTAANGGRGQTVPCKVDDEGAKYEMSFVMDREQAGALYKAMTAAYNEAKQSNWPKMPKSSAIFKKDDEGNLIGKAVLKGMYGSETVDPPRQFAADNTLLDEEFLLTTGSVVNIQVALIPYNMRDAGVSCRLRAVQVIEYKKMETASPFDKVDGGFTAAAAPKFEDPVDELDVTADELDDIPSPKASPKAKPVEVDEIDDGLDDLDFDDD